MMYMDSIVVLFGGRLFFLGINLIVYGVLVKYKKLFILDMVIFKVVFGKIL